jgi:Domain of unknown function (DUF5753)
VVGPLCPLLVGGGRRVTLQVLPFDAGAHVTERTGFIIICGPEPLLDVVHMSNFSGALYLEKEAELERHKQDHLLFWQLDKVTPRVSV